MSAAAVVLLTLRDRRRRLLGLLAFAALFLLASLAASLLLRDEAGHVELERAFTVGGYPLVSALLLFGWLLGRFPLLATLVLMAGFFSTDRTAGYARLYAVRPVSLARLYTTRFAALAGLAFALSALLMPAVDLLLLGTWAGPATLVLILAYVIAFGGLTALLSVWTRADAWLALLLAVGAIVWDALRRADVLAVPHGARDVITFVLPPQPALLELESAFGALQPIPWPAFFYVAAYGLVLLALAALSLTRREI